MEFCNLASGSRGNCSVISTNRVTIMVDDGLNLRTLAERARLANLDLSKVDAVLITHEHSDHVKGIASFCKKYSVPVYCHSESKEFVDPMICPYIVDRDMDTPFELGDLTITPFRLPHDSNYNLGYKISQGKQAISVATDLGFVSESTLDKLKGSDLVVLESNHDIDMLREGAYPFILKQRILGKNGHLSNDDCAAAILDLARSGTKRFLLAHLSQDNNTPEIAFDCAAKNLENNYFIEGQDVFVDIANQYKSTRKFII
ncbi:MAG: MBL fold metallo-hydrolase [Clostridia bacterium]|nr:MBL fold metallo-hydrolase [Clostridia bacterium]